VVVRSHNFIAIVDLNNVHTYEVKNTSQSGIILNEHREMFLHPCEVRRLRTAGVNNFRITGQNVTHGNIQTEAGQIIQKEINKRINEN
jgi:hypothetical protein